MLFFRKKKLHLLLILAFLTLIFFLNGKINDKKIYFPIKKISLVSHTNYSDKIKIYKKSKKYLSKKSFFNLKIIDLKKEIENVDWIRLADVRRVYPDEIEIYIIEHIPIAIWNDKMFLNDLGEIFFANDIDIKLPKIYSTNDRNKIIFKYFVTFSKNLIKNNIHNSVIKMDENNRRSLTIKLSSNIIIYLGSNDIMNKIDTFFKVYNSLNSSDLTKIRYIDMRYLNGFAVGWK
ncbi:MAG: cell division protein FtsQ [Gammaproteobacteria bacterium]|jgi:cell division protein FtsQ|nr:cell division protein FtsQ [Gammaproteobacteria bacterium]MBT7603060.1 cell division protein FtsQ [Gammaproteobacteria bacterium]